MVMLAASAEPEKGDAELAGTNCTRNNACELYLH
jgi:hypothetical protein